MSYWLTKYPPERGSLLPILHEIQTQEGYVSKEAVAAVARYLGLSASQVYGVLTFYSQLRTAPLGKKVIRICEGPACHLEGMDKIHHVLEAILGIDVGETTSDGSFSLEFVPCNGTCNHAPFLLVNDDAYRRVQASQIKGILEKYE